MGLRHLMYFCKKRAKKYDFTPEELKSDFNFSKAEEDEKRLANVKRESIYLTLVRENTIKRMQSYKNRKEIKAGEKESYRTRKFKAWQKRKKAYNRVN